MSTTTSQTRVAPRARSRRWRRKDYALPPEQLAPALLGHTLVRTLDDGTRLTGRITETEAYLGARDLSSHAAGGRRTPRIEPMFGPPGTSYVYFTYGMHHCLCIACGRVGDPLAVLLRAIEPIDNAQIMLRNRLAATPNRRSPVRASQICSGPGRLCQALDLDRRHTGLDMAGAQPLVSVEFAPASPDTLPVIHTGPRIGLSGDHEWTRAPLRFWLDPAMSLSR